MGPALEINSLSRGQEKSTMRESRSKSDIRDKIPLWPTAIRRLPGRFQEAPNLTRVQAPTKSREHASKGGCVTICLGRIPVISVVAILVIVQVSRAYEHPLDAHSVSNAYSLGRRNDETMTKFLRQYFKRLPSPMTGPYISDIEIQTPYVQVVWRAHDNPMTYSEGQAEKDYTYPFDEFLVRVRINLTPTYPAFLSDSSHKGQYVRRPDDFWRDFNIRIQQGSELTPKDTSFTAVYRNDGKSGRTWIGGDVTLKFDGSQLRSDPIRIDVLTPDGQTVQAKFDLEVLR
jgi:hypothetical protein